MVSSYFLRNVPISKYLHLCTNTYQNCVYLLYRLKALYLFGTISVSCDCVYICYTLSGCLILIDLKIFVHSFLPPLQLVLESEEQQSFTSTVVEDLEKGQSLAPTSPQAAYLLSSAYHRMAGMQQSMQLLETARGLFTEAIQKFPDFGDGLLLYAMVCEMEI